ncbi:MAG TPA: S41 family peptidase [Capillimicrobium sp.]|nr:S41 family peptidase [Capillimicrobium sp.]
MRRSSPLTVLLGVAAALVLLAAGIWAGGHPDRLPEPVRDLLVDDQEAQLVDEAIDDLARDYYRPVDRERLTDEAVAGMVDSLHDRFSHYFTPDEFEQYQRTSNAEFAGIGVEVREDPKGLAVVRVYDDSPARRAGIRTGDLIVGAEGKDLEGMPSEAATALIKGDPGTAVTLTTERDGRRTQRTLERALISVPVVASRMRRTPEGDEVAHVALATFSSGAHGELRQEIDRRLRQGAEGILLDLRHNGGGLLEEARLVASIFIPDGEIVTIRGRNQPAKTLDATGGAIDGDIPVTVLVDGETASAAEIVSGAIQDRDRGEVVGTHTFGKGVFQQVMQLSNGGALDITVGQYFLPSGRNLGGGGVARGRGIQPDVSARDDDKTDRDETVQAGLKVLGQQLDR